MIKFFNRYDILKNRNFVLISFLLILSISFSSFNPIDKSEQVFELKVQSIITQWYDLLLVLESKDVNGYPPVSSERIAGMGISGYIVYSEVKKMFDNHEVQALQILNSFYANQMLQNFSSFPFSEKEKIFKLRNKINQSLSETLLGSAFENEVYYNIITKRINAIKQSMNEQSDDSIIFPNNNNLSYNKFESENPVLPFWGNKKTLAVHKPTIHVPAPYVHSSSFEKNLFDDALSIYTLSMNLTLEDQWIAEFWSDDVRGLTFSPAGRWISITNQIVRKENIKVPAIFELYFNLGIGLYDAGVLCWQSKYHYMLERPSSYINRSIDKNWKPFHENPEFPAYPSGHAVFGSVAATILEHHFGKMYAFTDNSHQNRIEFKGSGRSFNSLKDMAIENAYSRIVMGVHYKEDCEAGLKLGNEVGNRINKIHPDSILNKMNLLRIF